MARRPRIWNLPQDEPPPAEAPKGKTINDASSSPSGKPSGATRIFIPEQTATQAMNDDRRPRRLNLPQDDVGNGEPATNTSGPRRLSVPEQPASRPEPPSQGVRRLSVPDAPSQPLPPQKASPRSINPLPPAPPPARTERPKSKTDLLIEKAQAIDPTVQMQRIRGRIDTILNYMTLPDILDWGKQNLDPLRDTSNRKAKIIADMARINAVGWLDEAKNASCKLPSQSLWGRLKQEAVKSPAYYEAMLQKVRAELLAFVSELNQMKNDFFREIGDLHCDAISMMVCLEEFSDPHMRQSADNRARTLLASHQTAAMLQQTIEHSLSLATQQVEQIDSFMAVTMPQWQMAYAQK